MEEYLVLDNGNCLDELKKIIEECLRNVPFTQDFQYVFDIICHNNYIIGNFLIGDERKRIFKIEMEENEIKYFYVVDSLQNYGIGSAILRFVLNLYRYSKYENIFAILGGCQLFSDWLCEYIENDNEENDENEQLKRRRFYERLGFQENYQDEQLYMYYDLRNM